MDHVYRPKLDLRLGEVPPLELNASNTATLAELEPMVDGKPDVTKVKEVDLE